MFTMINIVFFSDCDRNIEHIHVEIFHFYDVLHLRELILKT